MICACGYDERWHPDSKCPLCQCGAVPDEHVPVMEPPAPVRAPKYVVEWRCPGRGGPKLRRGSLRAAEPPEALRERSDGSFVPAIAAPAEPELVQRPPLVVARLTTSMDEIAPQAMKLGTAAADLGWTVTPWFWRAADGTFTSALVMHRGELRAVAYWDRFEGAKWRTAGARAWLAGQWPQALPVTKLAALITGMGR